MKHKIIWRLNYILIGLLLQICMHTHIWAQAAKPPLPIEAFFGQENLYFQMVVKKNFDPKNRFNFFSVATFTADYANERSENNILIPAQFSYTFWKGVGIMAGAEANSGPGFAPIAGLQYNFASRKFLIVQVASFFLNEENDFKIFGLYEFKPSISENWAIYSRLQYIYNFSIQDGSHNRSYLYLRAGLKRKSFIFGAGANLDLFGPTKIFRDNYGGFVRWEFH